MSLTTSDPFNERSSGILLHPTSLPGPYGVGDLGPHARAFADFLAAAGQSWWQMLPVGPPGAGFSPYDSPSAFAGSPLLISLQMLEQEGLLTKSEIKAPKELVAAPLADYQQAVRFKEKALRRAFQRFEADATSQERTELSEFNLRMASWLESYSLFTALKHRTRKQAWYQWAPELRARKPKALMRAATELSSEIGYCCFQQFLFDKQWAALKVYCQERHIRLLGDVPMFVAHDGADVWEHQHLFFLNERGERTFLAGVPPDYFSEDGQLWGNPLYRWSVLKETNYSWWIARLAHTLARFDALRLDHFIAFHRYWEIPGEAKSAKQGRFVKVPGKDFFKKVRKQLGGLPFVAEDLGLVTPAVHALREHFDLPGMRVLQFGFSRGAEIYQPHRYPRRALAYTGTHDNDTVAGWFAQKSADTEQARLLREEHARARAYAGSSGKQLHWDMIRLLLMSVANTTIAPMQDLLGLGSEARMNVPGTPSGNWRWRLSESVLTTRLAHKMRSLCELYERLPNLDT